ncbi:MAG: hypothetical protein FJ299_06210 [Planctomycetes bacterium]|nr:hypothetical protein [Planctomycetota bacterium]
MRTPPSPVARCLPLTLLALAACSGSGDAVIVLPGQTDFFEHEPNDTQFYANALGVLAIGEELAIHGDIDCFGCDPADGFKFSTLGPVALQFTLSCADAYSDLDLCVFDPSIGGYFQCFENGGPLESGTILLGGPATELHLVVSPFSGGGPYVLAVDVLPLSAVLATHEAEPVTPRSSGAVDYTEPALFPLPELTYIEFELDAQGLPVAQRVLEINRR